MIIDKYNLHFSRTLKYSINLLNIIQILFIYLFSLR